MKGSLFCYDCSWSDIDETVMRCSFFIVALSWQQFLSVFFFFVSAEQNLDAICRSTYRTACKLRYVQKRCNCESPTLSFFFFLESTVTKWIDTDRLSCFSTGLQYQPKVFVFILVHLIDIYNVIEAVRDAGLNAVELNAGITVTRLENLVSSLFNQLSKRMPTTHTINARECTVLLVGFLLAAIER